MQQLPVILDLCLRKTRSGKSNNYCDVIVFEKLRFQNVFRPHKKPAFSNFSGLKSVFEKLRFRDGLVWTVGLTVEIKLGFQIFSWCLILLALVHFQPLLLGTWVMGTSIVLFP